MFGEKMILGTLFQTSTAMVSGNSKSIIAFAEKDIVLFDVSTAKRVDSFTRLGDVSSLSFSGDDERLYVAGNIKKSATIEMINIKSRARSTVKEFGKETSIRRIGLSPRGTYLVAVCDSHVGTIGEIAFMDPKTGATLFSVSDSPETLKNREEGFFVGAFSFAFSKDETQLFCGHGDGTIGVWDVKSRKETARFQPSKQKEHISLLLLSDDEKLLVASSLDEVFVISASTFKTLAHFDDHVDIVTALATSPDGNLLFTSSHDRAVRCYSLKTNRLVKVFKRVHTQVGYSVLCLPYKDQKGLLIACGANDDCIWCWNVKATE